MNPKAVRITFWITGTISCLVLLLYLPVLIWSPPWSEDGHYLYYDKYNGLHIRSLDNSVIYYGYIGGHGWENFNDPPVNIHRTESDPYQWSNGTGIDAHIKDGTLRFDNDTDHDVTFIKSSNPFTLWYIKWLEWTAA